MARREEIVKGLKGTRQGGSRYPIPIGQRFELQFWKAFQEPERRWHEGDTKEDRG